MNDDLSRKWKALARLGLFAGPVFILLMVGFVSSVPHEGSPLPEEYAQLAAALVHPGLFHAVLSLDLFAGLSLAGTLLLFASVLAERAPIRALFIGAFAVGQVSGVIGGLLRISGMARFAKMYSSASADQQPAVLRSFTDFQETVNALFGTAALLYGFALLLIASAVWSLKGFPRWLAVVLAIPGGIEILRHLAQLATSADLTIVVPLEIPFLIATFFGLAARFWRRPLSA